MSKMQSTILFSTPWPFWTGILSQVSKNDDDKMLLLKIFGFIDYKSPIISCVNLAAELPLVKMN